MGDEIWLFMLIAVVCIPMCTADACGKAQVRAACIAHHTPKECKEGGYAP